MSKWIGIAGSVIGIIAVVVSATWFMFNLIGRVGTLESQVQTLFQASFSYAPETSGQLDDSSQRASGLDELARTCANLADRVADAYNDTRPFTVAQPLEDMMDRLGCNKLVNDR